MATRNPPRTAAGTRAVKLKRTPAFRAGIATRARVLGTEYVDRSIANADALTAPFQQIATEYAWGTVWQRKGLGLRDRSLATVAMCIALNRPDELRIHIRGALNNGMTRGEIGEVILHAFLYCGGPAALDAYKVAREVFAEPRAKTAKRAPAKRPRR
jgi:4-carboxymuconolactone decarboxylase